MDYLAVVENNRVVIESRLNNGISWRKALTAFVSVVERTEKCHLFMGNYLPVKGGFVKPKKGFIFECYRGTFETLKETRPNKLGKVIPLFKDAKCIVSRSGKTSVLNAINSLAHGEVSVVIIGTRQPISFLVTESNTLECV